jgi:hypothetical protein
VSGPPVIRPAGAATRARLRELYERPLSPEEYLARLAIPISDEERQETLELVRWFRRRYPTPGERLAWARRAYARWARNAS